MPSLPKVSIDENSLGYDDGVRYFGPTLENAINNMQSRSLVLPRPPTNGYSGEMPSNITSLSDDSLGELLNNISQYCSYVSGQYALIQAEYKNAETKEEAVRAHVRKEVKLIEKERKLTNSDRDDLMQTDARVLDAVRNTLFFYSLKVMTYAILEKTERDWETVSRRITQRGQDIERVKRTANVNATPNAVFFPQAGRRLTR